MSEGKRPGGLTALAVINFVIGAVNALGVLTMLALIAVMSGATPLPGDDGDEAKREIARGWEEIGMGYFYAIVTVTAVLAFLLIASGIGYLQQKKLLGRTFGNAYAVVSIGTSLVSALTLNEKVGGGFNLGTLVNIVYPVLTLLLLNTTFKHDFVR